MPEGDESRRNDSRGMTHIHHFYTDRNRLVLGALLNSAVSPACRWTINGILHRASKQHQIAITRIGGEKAGEGGATAGHRRGTWYVPSNQVEYSALHLFKGRTKSASKAFAKTQYGGRDVLISTCSASNTGIPSASIDYIFVDPPFGGNIMYSELNFVWESVLGVVTNSEMEAITNKSQAKKLDDYRELMVECFSEFNRILKPGHWMTVEFHNSKNSVWNAIQEALQRAKFVVADVRTLDKKLMTHTQRTAAGSVNKDLVISAYKPSEQLETEFEIKAGTEHAAWDFISSHLEILPIFVGVNDKCEFLPERQKHLLYDRMVAFHVQRGVSVPMSAAEFYAGLVERFPERDEMFFLPEQVTSYEKKRLQSSAIVQGQLFVTDELSAVEWLKRKLAKKPQTFQEVQPEFFREISAWEDYEKQLELSELLRENFLCFDGDGPVPGQIHAYLSSNFKELRNLAKDDSALRSKAKNRWYVPDPKKLVDLEKLRLRSLLREFEEYRGATGKLKIVRTESLRAGFRECWQKQDYGTIVSLSKRVKESIIQEDTALLMYYDNAVMLSGGD